MDGFEKDQDDIFESKEYYDNFDSNILQEDQYEPRSYEDKTKNVKAKRNSVIRNVTSLSEQNNRHRKSISMNRKSSLTNSNSRRTSFSADNNSQYMDNKSDKRRKSVMNKNNFKEETNMKYRKIVINSIDTPEVNYQNLPVVSNLSTELKFNPAILQKQLSTALKRSLNIYQ